MVIRVGGDSIAFYGKAPRVPRHNGRGNCRAEATVYGCPECLPEACDVCEERDAARGECDDCPDCPACAAEAAA